MEHGFHAPVMADRVLEFLVTNPGGIYLDGTIGGGGHAARVLQRLTPDGLYIGIDQDPDAIRYVRTHLGSRKNCILIQRSFADIPALLAENDVDRIDGLLLDLGMSSFQIDTPHRGFSYMQNGPLDMRMDQDVAETAGDILNKYSENELATIFKNYGEEKFSRRIARNIVDARKSKPIESTDQLCGLISKSVPGHRPVKSFARIFQALRIAVNRELEVLKKTLVESPEYIRSGGRIVVISYHSLEDRIVKKYFRSQESPCICPPDLPECICGLNPVLKILTRKAVRATREEIQANIRARSAVLRAAEVL